MQEYNTPLMKQYLGLKKQYPDCLLFFRLGDFYELFMNDAHIGAQVLDITLTSRPEGKDGRVSMAGVPYHAVDNYLARLVKAGYKVAICEQLSEPNNKGIVERDVVRIVSPGTLLDEKALEKKENNYLISLCFDSLVLSICYADLSTGDVQVTSEQYSDLNQAIIDELAKIHPSECILPESLYNSDLLKTLKKEKGLNIYPFLNWENYVEDSEGFLKKHFKVKTLASFGISDKPLALKACATLIGYLKMSQKGAISHIKKVALSTSSQYLNLDKSTIVNLELFSTIRDHDTKGSLLTVLDQTKTAMGGRMLKGWIAKPLTEPSLITKRLETVQFLYDNLSFQENLRKLLEEVPDMERIVARLSVGIGNARDLNILKESLKVVQKIRKLIVENLPTTDFLSSVLEQISPNLSEIINKIEKTLVDEPPVSLRDGGLIRFGINKQLDDLKKQINLGKDWIVNLEAEEKKRTGISTLKLRFNKAFGYYIEISKANAKFAPLDYIRKQTLVNGERFITPGLKEKEEMILTGEAEINEIEYHLFQELLKETLEYVEKVQAASFAVAALDCLSSLAVVALKKNYTKPKIIYSGEIKIKAGRHPVVEQLLEDSPFVPNNCLLNQTDHQLLLITGPNMAGKSVYIRSVALIVLLTQIGSFVPAQSVYISLVDRIFVRSGASDVITSGLSTFMVEMVETAHILNHASKNSLIVMDEIGRGTSTYDGISIAWAVAEYLVSSSNFTPKTLFTTHYHELQVLEEKFPEKIKNYHMAVDSSREDPIFLHTIMKGGASHSFGVAVAKLAGIPKEVLEKALIMLKALEERNLEQNGKILSTVKISSTSLSDSRFKKELEKIDINKLTPIEALNILNNMKEKYGEN